MWTCAIWSMSTSGDTSSNFFFFQQWFILCLFSDLNNTWTLPNILNFIMDFPPLSTPLRLPQTFISAPHFAYTSTKALLSTIQHVFQAIPCRWSPHELHLPYQLLLHGHMPHVDGGNTQRGGKYLQRIQPLNMKETFSLSNVFLTLAFERLHLNHRWY